MPGTLLQVRGGGRTFIGRGARLIARSTPHRNASMRAVVQRVLKASVSVDGQVVSQIGPGLLCLIGLSKGDETDSDARDYIARKILNGRVFKNEDTGKMWDQSVVQRSYEVLLVSQVGPQSPNQSSHFLASSPPDRRDRILSSSLPPSSLWPASSRGTSRPSTQPLAPPRRNQLTRILCA